MLAARSTSALDRLDGALDVGWTRPTTALAAFQGSATAHPAWVTLLAGAVHRVGHRWSFRIVAVGLIVALRRRQLRLALFLVLSVEVSGLLTEVAEGGRGPSRARRPRLVYAPSTSFPSGHALGVSAAVLALTVIVLPLIRRELWGWVVATGVLIVFVVGLGRVVLNVHNPSDVLAGWAAGYLWFAASLLVLASRPVTAEDEIPVVPGSVP